MEVLFQSTTKYTRAKPKVLDFDIENRPLSYLGNDYTTSEITAIAASFGPSEPMYCWLLGRDEPEVMLGRFVQLWDEADVVTGHYILMHDIPIINGALLEYGMPVLSPKLVSDTKVHLIKSKGVSKSQESLAAMLGIEFPKVHVGQLEWREANRLTPAGLALTEMRVTGDVRQHMAMRQELVNRNLIRPPRPWTP